MIRIATLRFEGTVRALDLAGLALLTGLAAILSACGGRSDSLDVIKATGVLRVAIFESRSTYHESSNGPVGYEHDLVTEFARAHGLKAQFTVVQTEARMRALLRTNRVHLAAGFLSVPKTVAEDLKYGPSYALEQHVVVHRRGKLRIRAAADLADLEGHIIGTRSDAQRLRDLLPKGVSKPSNLRPMREVDAVLKAVDEGELDYAVLPAREFKAARNYFPELVRALKLGTPRPVAWLYRDNGDQSLWSAMLEFFHDFGSTDELAALWHHYFGRFEAFDYVDSRSVIRHARKRLPPFREAFMRMGDETGFDWRLLAALAYQESRWLENARSPTGVRGLMMLTRATAKAYGVDRLDGEQSIRGGALYLADLKSRLPERIVDPDRTWLALAAYNIGLGHLEDARILTEKAGGNPDIWEDVRPNLRKLQNKRWARQTRYGFARGYQAIHFVDNTQRYFRVLKWLEAEQTPSASPHTTARPEEPLISPVL